MVYPLYTKPKLPSWMRPKLIAPQRPKPFEEQQMDSKFKTDLLAQLAEIAPLLQTSNRLQQEILDNVRKEKSVVSPPTPQTKEAESPKIVNVYYRLALRRTSTKRGVEELVICHVLMSDGKLRVGESCYDSENPRTGNLAASRLTAYTNALVRNAIIIPPESMYDV